MVMGKFLKIMVIGGGEKCLVLEIPKNTSGNDSVMSYFCLDPAFNQKCSGSVQANFK
jgi:hypothetical protein